MSSFKTLVSETRELLEFFDELGGESLSVEPDFLRDAERATGTSTPKRDAAPSQIPRTASTSNSTPPQPESKKTFSSLLESTKLSAISQLGSGDREVKNPNPSERPMTGHQGTKDSNTMKKNKDLSDTSTLFEIKTEIGNCTRCGLCEERTQVVHSIGNPNARLMFIGEAPGADEDSKGEPFVGRAGQLLTRIIDAMGFSRDDVFIGNINRCRPPGNRAPKIEEADQCRPFLIREIEIVKPEVIVVLGNTACQNLLNTKEGITKLRGNFQDYFGVKVMPTFHPAYLLRDPSKKKLVWEDMKQVMQFLESTGDRK